MFIRYIKDTTCIAQFVKSCHSSTLSCWFVLFKNWISSVCFFSSTWRCSWARFSICSHLAFSSLTVFSSSRFSSSSSAIYKTVITEMFKFW